MIKSMTAFGRAREVVGGRELTVEIKSVNNRYLDLNIRLPRIWNSLEERVRQRIREAGISRGKLEIYIGLDVQDSDETTVALDVPYLKNYLTAIFQLRDEYGLKDDISVMTVAQNRDVFTIKKPDIDEEKDWAELLPVLDNALKAYTAAREAEGDNLRRDILAKAEKIKAWAEDVAKLSPQTVAAYRARLDAKLRQTLEEIGKTADENRILTEIAIFADKVAVDEEVVRLGSHFTALETALNSDEPVGNRLNYILQEMGSEVNTIGSKANDSEVTAIVIEMKCELEKIREQIQNLE